MIRKLRDFESKAQLTSVYHPPSCVELPFAEENRNKIKIQSEYLPPFNIYTLKHAEKIFSVCV